VNIERIPAPLRGAAALAATEQATAPQGVSGGVDARSETGAGVGLASQSLPMNRTGRLLVLGGVAVAALGVGFAVPRLLSRSSDLPVAPSATGSSVTAAVIPVLPPVPASAVVLPPLPPATSVASDVAAAIAPAASAKPGAPVAGPGAGSGKGKAHPPATASAPAAASTQAPTTVKPPPGNDDDIK
jgi:hypothetical protein